MKRSVFTTTVKKVLNNQPYFDALPTDPDKAHAAVMKLFERGECHSPEAYIIRDYLRVLNIDGWVTWESE